MRILGIGLLLAGLFAFGLAFSDVSCGSSDRGVTLAAPVGATLIASAAFLLSWWPGRSPWIPIFLALGIWIVAYLAIAWFNVIAGLGHCGN